ncbi:MAG: hypothetical protein ACWA5U_03355 [bacterium]
MYMETYTEQYGNHQQHQQRQRQQTQPQSPNNYGECSAKLVNGLAEDLQRSQRWAGVIPFLEKYNPDLAARKKASPTLFLKHKRWLLNTERLTIAQALVYRELAGLPAMSQGELVRLLGGDPNREAISASEKREVMSMNRYWANQIRNNIHPIMADYFNLLVIKWIDGGKPAVGEYSIQASNLLMQFFMQKLYV